MSTVRIRHSQLETDRPSTKRMSCDRQVCTLTLPTWLHWHVVESFDVYYAYSIVIQQNSEFGWKMGKKLASKAKNPSQPSSSALASSIRQNASTFPSSLFMDPPKKPLSYKTLLKDYIWTVDNVLSPTECQNWINYMEQDAAKQVEYTQQRATRYMAARECYRLQRNDSETARRIFERIPKALLSILPPDTPAVACNPNIRLYKYCPGHSFGIHIDESNMISSSSILCGGNAATQHSTMMMTRVTVLIYLSECQGGATRFQAPHNNDQRDICYAPKTGSMLLHLHGDDCLPHQGDVVQAGIKYVLRSDLVYAR
jgi:hypothetical protein